MIQDSIDVLHATVDFVARLLDNAPYFARVRIFRTLLNMPQRPGSEETLLETVRRQQYENPSAWFLPRECYDPNDEGELRRLEADGESSHAMRTFAGLWLSTHREDASWDAIERFFFPHGEYYRTEAELSAFCLHVLRQVRDARA